METDVVIAIFGPLMPLVVSIYKYFAPEGDPRVAAVAFSVLVALVAGISKLALGEHFEPVLASVGAIAGLVFGIGTGLYKLQK